MDEDTTKEKGFKIWKCKVQTRYVIAIMCFYCAVNLTVLKVNLNIALVMMVKNPIGEFNVTNITKEGTTCKELLASVSNRTVKELHGGEFNWSRPLQGNLLGAFQIGSVFTPIPFTILGSKLHASKWILAIGGLLSGIMSLLAPVCARWHVGALIASKAIEGLGAGIAYPNIHCLVTNWIPNTERSRVNTFIYNGIAFATVATYTLSGPLMKSGFLGGWPAVFYISGLSGVVWFIVWIFLVYESPNEHPRITQEELNYITEKLEHKADIAAVEIPWKSILTSVPFWTLLFAHFCNNWGFFTLLTQLPTYMANVLFFDIVENGVISSLPFIVGVIVSTLASIIADLLRKKQFHITTIRKIMSSIAFFVPAACLLLIPAVGCRPTAIIALFTLANAFSTFKYSGYLITNMDMAPKYAGIIMALTGTFANSAGFLAPAFAGWITKTGHTLENWRNVFITTAAILISGGVVFDIFSQATIQPWGVGPENETDPNDTNESKS